MTGELHPPQRQALSFADFAALHQRKETDRQGWFSAKTTSSQGMRSY